jgi:hypothetical protein
MRSQDENSTQGERKGGKKKETGSTKLVYRPKLILGEVTLPSFGFSLPVQSLLLMYSSLNEVFFK